MPGARPGTNTEHEKQILRVLGRTTKEAARNTSSLALELLDVIDARLANFTASLDFNAVDEWRVNKECSVDANSTCRNLADHERAVRGALAVTDHRSFESLKTELGRTVFVRTFRDLHQHRNGVAGAEIWKFGLTEKLRFKERQIWMLHILHLPTREEP